MSIMQIDLTHVYPTYTSVCCGSSQLIISSRTNISFVDVLRVHVMRLLTASHEDRKRPFMLLHAYNTGSDRPCRTAGI